MPELPEVETIRRTLEPQIKGSEITSVTVHRPEIVAHPAADDFCRLLVGQTVSAMTRRGKFLGIALTSGDSVILHLRMTGCLLATLPDYSQEKHTHVVFHLKNGMELRFSDTRRFGRFWLIRKGETDTYSGIDRLGLEPFDKDFNADYLQTYLGKRKKVIKECLLDQSMIAGIGNIYSDEILFTAKIHPSRPANSLTAEEWECLASVIPERLGYFIEKNSLTPEEYLESKGQNYRNTPFLQVYGHANEPCPHCGNLLQRTVIGGRSSVYCPECQAADM
jgi:formamidopyrimidine-DNA glycosylase